MAEKNKQKDKKIIVDEDWKSQAQREKEILTAQEKQQKEEPTASSRGPLPPGNFAALISMLVTQALFALGAVKIEGQPDKEPDLELARYNIDMLQTLEEKTKGNLSEEEQKVLTNTLNEVRMAYVKMADEKK